MALPEKAAVLGLGIIGSRAYARLTDAGCKMACWNRTPRGLPGETVNPEEAVQGAAVISITRPWPNLTSAVRKVDLETFSTCCKNSPVAHVFQLTSPNTL